MTARPETSHWYDGRVYAAVIDRLLAGLGAYVVEHLPEGSRVLDACCGTGSLSRRLAEAGRTVVAVDLSSRHIEFAQRQPGAETIDYRVGDVAALPLPPEGRYDVSVIVLALHEMPSHLRAPVLRRLLEVSRRTMVVDFVAPMPRNVAGLRNRAAEAAAGRQHFAAFRDWQRSGGLETLLGELGSPVESDRLIDRGTLRTVVLAGDPDEAERLEEQA